MLIHRNLKYSRRQWDGLIKAWKLQIHSWNAKGDTDVFQKIDEWQNKEEDDPILGGPSKEKYSTKGQLISKRPFGVIVWTTLCGMIYFIVLYFIPLCNA